MVLARRDCGRLVIGSPPRPRGCKWGRVGEAGRRGKYALKMHFQPKNMALGVFLLRSLGKPDHRTVGECILMCTKPSF